MFLSELVYQEGRIFSLKHTFANDVKSFFTQVLPRVLTQKIVHFVHTTLF